MLKRICAAAALTLVLQSGVVAQTMRFTTNVGSFDMVLNPTNDPNLQPLVDNIVAYIGLGRYHYTAINRAVEGGPGTADDFVLQMGGFLGFPPTPENYLGLVQPVETLSPVIVDGNGDGSPDFSAISNTRGTVSLALQAGNPNSGTSSFFINLNSNTNLDSMGFVPFARVDDLTTVERIMALTNVDLTGGGDQSSFDDVPLTENNRLVILRSVRVLEAAPEFSFVGPISAALDRQASQNAASSAPLAMSSSEESITALLEADELPPGDSAAVNVSAVPEPSTVALGLLGVFASLMAARRGKKP